MSVAGNVVLAIIKVLFAMIVGGIATPIMWFILRLLDLIRPLALVFGGLTWLMFVGGAILGAIVGGITLAAVMASFDEVDRLSVILGALGGAVGGLASSVMFFPIVAIL